MVERVTFVHWIERKEGDAKGVDYEECFQSLDAHLFVWSRRF
jgi:hypothetical protein